MCRRRGTWPTPDAITVEHVLKEREKHWNQNSQNVKNQIVYLQPYCTSKCSGYQAITWRHTRYSALYKICTRLSFCNDITRSVLSIRFYLHYYSANTWYPVCTYIINKLILGIRLVKKFLPGISVNAEIRIGQYWNVKN